MQENLFKVKKVEVDLSIFKDIKNIYIFKVYIWIVPKAN